MEISYILTQARSGDLKTRQNAELEIENAAKTQFPKFLTLLSLELSDEAKIKENRQLAALLIKNFVVFNKVLQEKFLQIDESTKNEIKSRILATLASNIKEVRKSAASTIAGICKIEIPLNQWPDIIDSLVNNSFNSNSIFRLSSLETIGYICEELASVKGIKSDDMDKILTSLVKNLEESNDINISESCLKALYYSIPISSKNFKSLSESQFIFNSLFKTCQNFIDKQENESLFLLIFQIFIEVVNRYYFYIDAHMEKIAELTLHFMQNKSPNEKLKVLSFEFWCTLGEKEIELKNQEGYKNYFEKSVSFLLPIIFENIKKFSNQFEDDDINDWNLSKASAYLLSILVKFCNRQIFDELINYIKVNLNSSDWRAKNESLLIFGCVLNSNYRDVLYEIVKKSLSGLIILLQDPNTYVRKTTSWLFSKICEIEQIYVGHDLEKLISSFLVSLKDKPFISINVCYSIINLAKSLGDRETLKNSNQMSNYFKALIEELLILAYKEESYNKEFNVSMVSFLCISTLIEYSSHDKQEVLETILNTLLRNLEETTFKNEDPEKSQNFQIYISTAISSILVKYLRKLNPIGASKIYQVVENCFKSRGCVFEEGISAISSLSLNQGADFDVIMPNFVPYLKFALTKFNEATLIKSAVIAVGDISKSIGNLFIKYSEEIVICLINILKEEDVSKYSKTVTISVLGDIALSIGELFFPYLENVLEILFSACHLALSLPDEGDDDESDYLEELRLCLIECFTSIAFAMKDANKTKEFAKFVPGIIEFLKNLAMPKYNQSNNFIKSSLGFVADMCTTYGKEIKILIVGNNFIFENLARIKMHRNKKNSDFIDWVEEVIKAVVY